MYIILYIIVFIAHIVDCKNILVLSGGGSHGAFEAGVVKNLVESGKSWDMYTGVSAGSLNAMFLSFYDNPKDASTVLTDQWAKLKTNNIYKGTNLVFPYMHRSFLDNKPLRDFLTDFINKNQYTIKVPLHISATSLKTGNTVVFKNMTFLNDNKVEVLMASSALPALFPVVELNGNFFNDGGVISNICIKNLFDDVQETYHLDIVTAGPMLSQSEVEPDNLIYLIQRNLQIMGTSNIGYHYLQNLCDYTNKLTYTIYSPLKAIDISMLNFDHGNELIDQGYKAHTQQSYDCRKNTRGVSYLR